MKNKKMIGFIVAANFAVGLTAFAQNADQQKAQDAAQPQQQQDQAQPALTPPPLPGALNEPAGAATAQYDKEKFIKDCAQNGIAEVNMSQVATQKAEDPALKEAAQKLVTDHSKLNEQVKELAQKKGITLSTEVDSKHQKMIDHLSSLSGAEFDKAFATHMAQGHKKSIAKFKQAAANTEDMEISQFAKATLPTLQEHLALIQKWAPDASAGAAVDEPAGAEKKSDQIDSGAKPDYKSAEPNKSDATQTPDDAGKTDQPK